MKQELIKKMCPGLFHAPAGAMASLMADYSADKHFSDGVWEEIFNAFMDVRVQLGKRADIQVTQYTVDVKVHMLMPGQWPSIPSWHYDMVPRDENLRQKLEERDTANRMYLWVSGPPLTEFYSEHTGETRYVEPQRWEEFSQFDLHRGVVSNDHQWRVFIRLVPTALLPIAPKENWRRVHSQVYCDVQQFNW